MRKEGIRIGLFSRIDAGSPGYRRGLIKKAFETFGAEKTHFNVLLGGLVSKKAVAFLIKEAIESIKRQNESNPENKQKINKKEVEDIVLDALVSELAEAFPRLPRPRAQNGKLARLYLMTSPAYDGEYGEKVAKKLTGLRQDIRYWSEADEHFPLKGIDKKLLCLVPKKESWRSEYDSAPVDREVKDHQKRTTRSLPDLYAVGGFASSIFKPRGETARHYLSTPALHKLGEVKTSENQIGVTVVEVFPKNEDILVAVRTYSFKDLVGMERQFIEVLARCSETQKKILMALKERGALTIGLFEDVTGVCRKKLKPCLDRMEESERFQPGIHMDKASERYDFDAQWIQTNLVYPNGEQNYQEDVIAGFGCLHAGDIHTDHEFFVNEFPAIILENEAKVLLGLGDFIKGLKHNLIERGEVIGGLNYTFQEAFAAHLVAEVILKVFKARFQKALEPLGEKQLTAEELKALVADALLTFVYIRGNHDEWEEDEGVTPLVVFRYELVKVLKQSIAETIAQKGYFLPELDGIVEGKVVEDSLYTLPSGITMEMLHPHMARAKTTVLRVQDTIQKSEAQLVWSANYHVAVGMDRWDPERGQRTGMQLGTIVHKTKFEENKGKKLDTGVACLRVRSRDKRIMMSEKIFYIAPFKKEGFDNLKVLTELEKKIGIKK